MFQGVAEAELEKDLERTFKIFFSRRREGVSGHRLHQVGMGGGKPLDQCSFSRRRVLRSALQESALEVRRSPSVNPLQTLLSRGSCCIFGGLRWSLRGPAGGDSLELHADGGRAAVLRQPVQRERLQVRPT